MTEGKEGVYQPTMMDIDKAKAHMREDQDAEEMTEMSKRRESGEDAEEIAKSQEKNEERSKELIQEAIKDAIEETRKEQNHYRRQVEEYAAKVKRPDVIEHDYKRLRFFENKLREVSEALTLGDGFVLDWYIKHLNGRIGNLGDELRRKSIVNF